MFITFEGIDGCGKTTQSVLLAKYLSDLHGADKVVLTREPGGTSFNDRLRNMFFCESDYKIEKLTELFLFLAMRNESFAKVVKRSIQDGKIVISDRCIDSTVAYQGYGHGIDLELIKELNDLVAPVLPDITFIIDVDTQTALARASKNGYEGDSVDFYNRVKEGFSRVAETGKQRCRVVCCKDGEENDIYAVHRKVVSLFHERYGKQCSP